MKLDRRILNRTIEIIPIVLILAFILLNSTAFTGFSVYNFVSGENLSINPIEEFNLSIPINETREEIIIENETEIIPPEEIIKETNLIDKPTFETINDTGITIPPYEIQLGILALPTHSNPIINTTSLLNTTSENLTAYNNSAADTDGDRLKHIWNWWVNNESIAVLNIPFEGNGSWSNILTTSQTADYSGRENHGTENGDAAWNATGGHDGFGAYEFDGTSDSISFGDILENMINKNDAAFSISAWFKRDANVASNDFIVSKYDNGPFGKEYFISVTNSDTIHARYYESNSESSGISRTTTTTISDEVWYHVVANFDVGNDKLEIFLNGVSEGSNTTAITDIPNNDIDLRIGADAAGTINEFDGTIDDVIVFNRTLSATQVLEIYQGANRTGWDLITSDETKRGEYWKASLTLNDGLNDSTTLNTSELFINQPPTFSNAANETGIQKHQNITLNITISDQNNLANYTIEWNDTGPAVNISTFQIPLGYTTWNANTSVNITATQSQVVDWRYYTCDVINLCSVSDTFSFTVANTLPTHSAPIINTTIDLSNTTDDNLTAYNNSAADIDNDRLKHIWNWWVNNESIAVLNMPFEGNDGSESTSTIDYSGKETDGTVNNAIWNVTGGHDGFGAYEFDGADDSISFGDILDDITNTNDAAFSISVWFKRNANVGADDFLVAKYGDTGFNVGYFVSVTDSDTVHAKYYENANSETGGISRTTTTTISDGVWYHVLANFDVGNDKLEIFLNGVSEGSNTTAITDIDDSAINFRIGTNSGGTIKEFDGTIDDVIIFNRTLSATQVLEIYQGLNRTGWDLITSDETKRGEYWKASLTLNDGLNDSITLNTTELLIDKAPTFSSALNETGIQKHQNITLNITISDQNNLANYTLEWNDTGPTVNISTFQIPLGYTTWNANTSVNITATQSQVVNWRYYACDVTNLCSISDTFNFTVSDTVTKFTNATNETGIQKHQNITLNITITDIDEVKNYTLEWNDTGPAVNISTFQIPSGYTTWDANTSVNITATASQIVNWRYYTCDSGDTCNVSDTFSFTVSDTVTKFTNATNETGIGRYQNITLNITITDIDEVKNYTLEWNDTGPAVNISTFTLPLGYTTWDANTSVNITATVNQTVWWRYYTCDSGDTCNVSNTFNFTVLDTVTKFTNAANETEIPRHKNITLNITIFDVDEVKNYTLEWNDTGPPTNISTFVVPSGYTYWDANTSVNITATVNQIVQWKYYTCDSGGTCNVSDTFSFTVINSPITFSTAANATNVTTNENITLNITIFDVDDIKNYTIEWNDTGPAINITTFQISSGYTTWAANTSVKITAAVDQKVWWRYYSCDIVNNCAVSDTFNFTVTNNPMVFSNATNGTGIKKGENITLNITITDADNLANYSIEWTDVDGTPANITTFQIPSGYTVWDANESLNITAKGNRIIRWRYYSCDIANICSRSAEHVFTVKETPVIETVTQIRTVDSGGGGGKTTTIIIQNITIIEPIGIIGPIDDYKVTSRIVDSVDIIAGENYLIRNIIDIVDTIDYPEQLIGVNLQEDRLLINIGDLTQTTIRVVDGRPTINIDLTNYQIPDRPYIERRPDLIHTSQLWFILGIISSSLIFLLLIIKMIRFRKPKPKKLYKPKKITRKEKPHIKPTIKPIITQKIKDIKLKQLKETLLQTRLHFNKELNYINGLILTNRLGEAINKYRSLVVFYNNLPDIDHTQESKEMYTELKKLHSTLEFQILLQKHENLD